MPRLNKNGILLLSAEISEEDVWKIQDSMRFSHHPEYIHSILESHGLQKLHCSRVVARQENEQNLYATLFIYQKVDDNAL